MGKSLCIVFDKNDTFYICDHDNKLVDRWIKSATSGITRTSNGDEHPDGITFDKNGVLYVIDHQQ